MISAKRIVSLFHQTGGGDEFTKTAEEFTEEQLASFRENLGDEQPLIISVRSAGEWFVLTHHHLVLKEAGPLRRVLLDNIEWIVTQNENYKLRGGRLGVRLKDGSVVSLDIQTGKSYVAMMNVFMYIARVTGKPSGRGLSAWPTTDDQRPTTQL